MIPKTIGDLNEHRFFVPSYQRGYRWTEQEVTALLDDISEFSIEGGKQYCIQPLIVKRREDESFEVVDGQQRLTTIYIFMKIAEEKTEYIPFDLEYETRANSQYFLSNLKPRGNIDKDNIDYFHITIARNTINSWLDKQKNRYIAINELFKRFIESVIFIWYELPFDRDPIAMFTKVNLGKIPLTNAELIKAVLLNKDNFNDVDKRQLEISLAWDRIEQGLQNDSFWYFLNEKEESGTRIDLLFSLLATAYNKELKIPIRSNPYFSFLVLFESLKLQPNKEKFVETLWNNIEQIYATFQDWYADLDKYHIIGYLIATGVSISDIFSIMRNKRKSAVMADLLGRTRKTIPGEIDEEILSDISYDSSSGKRSIIRKILLLFNIATLVCKSEKQYRFPFDIYKRERWDIEHIHATADETGEADDLLGNLTLLEGGINRSYKNKPFTEKRMIILERESKGLFVALCTKNIFLKAYSGDLSDMKVWGDDDKNSYISAMAQTLHSFFNRG